ncbi:MAG: indolepyruvate oxidoreductase subunit beta [Lachnospiraceae bacterium]|nr:indolepyruvate oxidoreductase subunit beta [Lachnospiraceae bacterium]MBQ3907321.1 indolepyruvate oxidoreductase subunit beta [Lachnospiraceae bacterium]
MSKSIILCGVGGQGTILASRLIASAAMKKNLPIKTAETIGMAQRGGSVFSHLRIGEADTPLIAKGQADLIIAFEPGEAVRQLPFLRKGGAVVVSSRPVMPVSAMIGKSTYDANAMLTYLKENVEHLTIVDADQAAKDLGSAKTLNVVLLGAAIRSGELGLDEEEIIQAMKERIPEKLWNMNLQSLAWSK